MVTRNRLRVGRKQVLPSRNFVDWKTDDPKELKRQLFDFEKHLSVLVEQNAQLLRIIDGNQTPNRVMPERGFLTFQGGLVRLTQDSRATIATIEHGDLPGGTLHEQADSTQDGFAPSTDGSTTGWVLTVQSDGTIAYAASTGVTDHGALTGLSDDDHTHYLLVSGGRALGGTWSLGGNTLNNAGIINSVSTNNLALNAIGAGADIVLTAADTVSVVATAGGVSVVPATTFVVNSPLMDLNLGSSGLDVDSTGEINLQTTNGHIQIHAAGSGRDVLVSATDDISLNAADTVFLVGSSAVAANAPAFVIAASNVVDADVGAGGFDLDSTGPIDLQTNGANVNISAAGGTRDVNVTATGEINLNAPIIDAVSNPIHNIEALQLDDGDALTGQPTAGKAEIRSYSGPDSTNPGGMLAVASRLFLWRFPVDVQVATGASGGDELLSTINFASVRGYNFSSSTIRVRVDLQSTRTSGTESAYSGQDEYAIFYVSTNQSGNAQVNRMTQGDDGADILDQDNTNNWSADHTKGYGIFATATSASTIEFRGVVSGTNTRRAIMVVSIDFAHVP